jgi:hypothetical protein
MLFEGCTLDLEIQVRRGPSVWLAPFDESLPRPFSPVACVPKFSKSRFRLERGSLLNMASALEIAVARFVRARYGIEWPVDVSRKLPRVHRSPRQQ